MSVVHRNDEVVVGEPVGGELPGPMPTAVVSTRRELRERPLVELLTDMPVTQPGAAHLDNVGQAALAQQRLHHYRSRR